jgi:5-methylcytosine-specific restriction endonuclease McrA
MSPLRSCSRHGRPRCSICARDRAVAHAARQRPGRGNNAAYDAMADAVLEAHGDRCHYCGAPVERDGVGDAALELAHVISHRDGGDWTADNLRWSHRLCNRTAGA